VISLEDINCKIRKSSKVIRNDTKNSVLTIKGKTKFEAKYKLYMLGIKIDY